MQNSNMPRNLEIQEDPTARKYWELLDQKAKITS